MNAYRLIMMTILAASWAWSGMAGAEALKLRDTNSLHERLVTAVPDRLFSGTIEQIDPAAMKVLMMTGAGLESLPVANTEVIQRLILGRPVTVELDEQGRVARIVQRDLVFQPAPELIN